MQATSATGRRVMDVSSQPIPATERSFVCNMLLTLRISDGTWHFTQIHMTRLISRRSRADVMETQLGILSSRARRRAHLS